VALNVLAAENIMYAITLDLVDLQGPSIEDPSPLPVRTGRESEDKK
jgi:hypothetical protein